MAELRRVVVTIVELVIVVALAIFAVDNIRSATYNFAGRSFTGNVWWIVVGSAALGFLLAAFLLVFGRVSPGQRRASLNQQRDQNAQQLTALRREHERLRGEYAQTATERDQYRSQLADLAPANQMAAPATDGSVPRQEGAPAAVETTTTSTTQAEQPTVASESGWRNPFRLRRAAPDEAQMPDGTASPTA